ncbi:MAG: LytTR family DNA-binding domain-containing protein [Rhodospirillaceae bacterium]|nr:LytTR family DNA-binding domain-containing protein [Rhodospirillaceae bacterium]
MAHETHLPKVKRDIAVSTAVSFLVPAFAALLLGWYGAGIPTTGIGSSVAITYWLAILLTTWLAFEIGSWAADYVLRPLTPPFIVVILIGSIVGGLTARPFVVYIIGTFLSVSQGDQAPTVAAPQFVWSTKWLLDFIQEAAVILLLWIGTNFMMRGPLHLRRFGFAPTYQIAPYASEQTGDESGQIPDPEFIKRLDNITQDEISALEAEDHYVRVHTEGRSELIHYRFSDAVHEQRGQEGLQVHRSYWVSKTAIESIVRRGRSFDIVLKGGKRVPVGQTYKQSAATGFKEFIEG